MNDVTLHTKLLALTERIAQCAHVAGEMLLSIAIAEREAQRTTGAPLELVPTPLAERVEAAECACRECEMRKGALP